MYSIKSMFTTTLLLLLLLPLPSLSGVFDSDTFEEEVSKINTIANAIPKSKGKENFQQIRDRFYR